MSIHISKRTAEALSKIGMGDFYVWEPKERMAYIVLVLKKLPDSADVFPCGKWATIQHIEQQLDDLAIKFLTDYFPKPIEVLTYPITFFFPNQYSTGWKT